MRIIHVSDLHLGLQYHEFSLVLDQTHILQQIIEKISAHKADVLLISGDIYHKYAPSDDSFKLWSSFLEQLKDLKITTYIISGNHDAPGKLGVGAGYLEYGDVYLESEYDGTLKTYSLTKDDVEVHFTLLPFIRPSFIQNHHEDFKSRRYHDAIEYVLKDYDYSKKGKHILLAHQFVIDGTHQPELSDSEVLPQVGGIDAIHASALSKFDYVALGHIHKPQKIRNEFIRYSGSPMKYSKSEANDKKGYVLIDVGDDITVSKERFTPYRDTIVLKGTLKELIDQAPHPLSHHFVHVILTDEIRPTNPMAQLQAVYPYCVEIEFQGSQSQVQEEQVRAEEILKLKPNELVSQFYETMLGKSMNEKTQSIVDEVLNIVLEDQHETD